MGKLAVNILRTAAPGKYSDGAGLYLLVTGRDERGRAKGSWIFRYTYLKQRYELGLGSVQSLSLAQARMERDRWHDLMTDKRFPVNPIEEKRRLEVEAHIGRRAVTLNEVAPMAFDALKGSLRDDGKAGRWFSPLRLYVLPELGSLKIEEIHQRDIERVLRPIWKTKAPTAKKALDRLGAVMKHGAAMGLDINLNAVLNAKQLLGHSGHVVDHHPALPWKDVPRFYQSLKPVSAAQRALMFYTLIGGGTRLKPVRLACADQFSDGVWTIPGENLKGRKGKVDKFRVPVTSEMQKLVDISIASSVDGLLFPSAYAKEGRMMAVSDQAIENIMRKREQELGWPYPYRPHGIRATFRSWASEINPNLYAVAETALAHKIGGIVERSYDRNDFLEQRRNLMEQWGELVLRSTSSDREDLK